MREITITMDELQELMKAKCLVEILERMVRNHKYIGREDVMQVLGIEEGMDAA